MLNVPSLASLEIYAKHVEKLVMQWSTARGLVYGANDAARAERMAKLLTSSSSRLGSSIPMELPVHPLD